MQPTTLFRQGLAPAVQEGAPGPSGIATSERLVERPHSAVARGSYAWPAWAVVALAAVAIIGGLYWWLGIQRAKRQRTAKPNVPSEAAP